MSRRRGDVEREASLGALPDPAMCWSAPLPVFPVAGPSAAPWLPSASATSAASGVEKGKTAAGPVGGR